MPEKKEEKSDEEVIIPFHYEAEIVKSEADLKGHRFIQRGPWLHCSSCKNSHGIYIGIKKMLVGYDKEGNPRLVARR